MKRQSEKLRRFQKWKSAYVMRCRHADRPKTKTRRVRRHVRKPNSPILVAPSHFVLISTKSYQAGNDVRDYFNFLAQLRAVRAGKLLIDMSGVRRMIVDAALLFKAELSKLWQLGGVQIDAIAPTSPRTQEVLKQTGIDKLLNLKLEVAPVREDVIHWRIAEGPRTGVDPADLEPMMADIEQVTGLATHPVYQGIIESIGNCAEHAYK